MKTIFRSIRWLLGQLIVFIDWITRPRPAVYSAGKQVELDETTSRMKLYHFRLCPFCVKTRRTIRRLGLNIETRDARYNPQWNRELIDQGGRYQVPCLRHFEDDGSEQWMYGADKIIQYLDRRFG
jgi:glutaredoxin